ncbi:hypothetical protein K443DRAFT_132467 [Laccaria amethystina LaAM-08-1]|uniref:Uncharacterized protein n=1 Tax=Laccaria amethystina LaAM-08-1 TaxID=1095629 RepID=A0A0C9XHQ1_9AGAR|nr:hypothetical protein K443DRAFT_132467 [Laccaria amethystina LaAM-08-1]
MPSQVAPSQPSFAHSTNHTLSGLERGELYRQELFAQCADGKHDPTRKYGLCGIITAIFCFPFGLICLCIDSERRCSRCGVVVQ